MPPRIVNGPAQTGGLGAFLESIPPITRFFAGSIFCCALAAYLKLLNPFNMALMWPQVYTNYHVSCEGVRWTERGVRWTERMAWCAARTARRAATVAASSIAAAQTGSTGACNTASCQGGR